jgi:CelD/BcsL family acetyltransferase involved in cellulose biosynthesis
MRLFERRSGGRLEEVTDADAADELVTTLRILMGGSWGEREAYFRRDASFGPFLEAAVRSTLEAGQGWALVARDGRGIAACLVMLALREVAVATLIGVSRDAEYRSMSLGKCLFHEAIDDAVARGCRRFSFLTEDGYKRSFWRAEGRPIESGFLARGVAGSAIAAMVRARRAMRGRIPG